MHFIMVVLLQGLLRDWVIAYCFVINWLRGCPEQSCMQYVMGLGNVGSDRVFLS